MIHKTIIGEFNLDILDKMVVAHCVGKPSPKKCVNFRMPPDLIAYIDKLAAKELCSKSQIVCMILAQHKVTNGS
jgi:hypothetical protein